MAANFKMAKNWFFDQNLVSFTIFAFCFLFKACILIKHISQKKSLLSDSRWRRVSKMEAGKQESLTLEFSNIGKNVATSLNFDQQHESKPYFVKLAKNVWSIQDGGSKSKQLSFQ
jgi:hypothetical protein